MSIRAPYYLFIGDAIEPYSIKLAMGIATWRPELAVGELSLEGCKVTTGLVNIDIDSAIKRGAKTLVMGFANNGGTIENKWIATILRAIESGMDIASGLHQRLDSVPQIAEHAKKYSVQLIDVRHPSQIFETGTGNPRTGKRLLTVGTDCSAGKMFTALAIHQEMQRRKLDASFRATGQSGIFIAGNGVAIDCVVADFIAGAVEYLSPVNENDHWDIIEGQGSLFHPAFAGVSLGLLHGAQADALVLCHVERREHMRGIPGRLLPSIEEVMQANLNAARLTNANAQFIGLSVNTSMLSESESENICQKYQQQFDLPCVDPLRHGVVPLMDSLQDKLR